MEQSSMQAILEQTRLENLLRHYDMNDFIQFLAKKHFLSSSEVTSIPNSKQEAIRYIASRDKFHSQFLQVFEQYTVYITDDVTIALAEMLPTVKLTVRAVQQQLSHDTESESDSLSPSSFSDDSDPGINLYSQAFPTHSSECSGILQDSGYYTQSNTQSLSDTAQLPSLPKTRSKQPATKSYSQSKRTKKVYITKNYCNNYYMDPTSMKNVRLPSTEEGKILSREEHYDDQLSLESSIDEKIQKFKKALRKHSRDLIEYMNVQSLLPYLQEQELLTTHEYEKLTQEVHTKTPSELNHFLLRILPTKGEYAFERFLKCLTGADEHLGHKQLVKLLRR